MKINLCICFLFSLFLASCERDIHSKLTEAERLLSTAPDSALLLLDQIKPEELNVKKEAARYAVLTSMALDKNYIDVTSDSLINKAVEFYNQKGISHYRMLSWYYHGIVMKNAGNYTAAIISFEKAEKDAIQMNDTYNLGLIYKNKAFVFGLTNNNPAAIDCIKRAISCFDSVGKVNYKAYAEFSLATDYSNQLDYDKADSLFSSIIEQYDDSLLLRQCNLRQAGILVKKDTMPQEAINLFRSVPRRLFSLLDYSYLAKAFEMISERDSADYWLKEGYAHCRDGADSASLDYMKSRIEIARGHYKEAFHLVDHAAFVQDSLTRVLLQQSISVAQRDFYKNENLLQEERIQSLRQRTLFGIVFGILIMSLLAMTAVIRSRKKDQLLQKQMARLALEERELERVNRDNAHLVGSLFSEKIDHLDRLSDSYFKMDEGKDKELAFKQIKELVSTIRKDDNLFLSLEKDLDRYCNGIMSKLSSQVPRISGDNRRIIALFFAGYSYEIVKLILNKMSVESLKTARSRFRKEIKESGAPDTSLFLKMLEMKKRPQTGTNENIGEC